MATPTTTVTAGRAGDAPGPEIPAWRQFPLHVRRIRKLSPSFVRVTLTGPELDRFADYGYDQRVKVAFPLAEAGMAYLPSGPDWYQRWRQLPDERRNPVRTYTVRAVRPDAREVDIDLVHHGDTGPGSRWAGTAGPGDPLTVIGPDARHPGPHGGREFRPPDRGGPLLLGADETAVPAVGAILERLPDDARGEALLEVPTGADVLPLAAPPRVRVTWLPRGTGRHGDRLIPAVRSAALRLFDPPLPRRAVRRTHHVDVDRHLLWEVPVDGAVTAAGHGYAWLAGEAGVIRLLRRHLVDERGMDRGAVAFMGYWRTGRTEHSLTA